MHTDPDMGTPEENLSTEHQKEGDARFPSDTLDKQDAPDPRDFVPGRDEGKAKPSGG
jgi:hypothetical protein